jgi:hypothetical protein
MKKIILYSILLLAINACNKKNTVANSNDYEVYLNSSFLKKQLQSNEQEISFWQNKLKEDTGSFVYMMQIGQNTLAHFKLTGQVNDIYYADSLFITSAKKLKNKEASIYFALAQNAITQHKFKDAEKHILMAEKIGANDYTINLVKFDIYMELGKYADAENCLFKIKKNTLNFDYLIRKSKFEDHKGNTDLSIKNMEFAYEMAIKTNKKSTLSWVTTNLADMYSHDGRINDAYNLYLKSLQLDSANLYALKGIASICFANDKNTEEAKKIINFLLANTDAPDLYLTLYDINEYKKNNVEKNKNLQTFLTKVNNGNYGNMYNKYLINIYTNEQEDKNKALAIAENEMKNRTTPETYTWLAYANYKANNIAKANELLNSYVLNKTSEPHSLFSAAVILKDSNKKLSNELVKRCKESEFELGPIIYEQLKMMN